MTYEPGRGGHVVVANPQGFSTAVSITAASGRAITVYTDTARTVSVSMPDTITTTKQYYLDRDDAYVISTKVNSVECGIVGTNTTPASQYIGGEGTFWVAVDRELAEQAGSAAYLALGKPVFDATNSKYGTTNDQAQINAAIADAAAAGGGTVFVSRAVNWQIGRANPASQTGGGIAMQPGVNLVSDGATLTLTDNCNFIWAKGTTGTPYTITADTTISDSTVTIGAGTTGISVGDSVFLQLGQAAYDTGEPDYWLFATVLGKTGTTVTLDRPVNYAMTVASVTNAVHKSLSVLTSSFTDISIGGFRFINPQTGNANAESAITITYGRNIRIFDCYGEHVGAGMVTPQFVDSLLIENVGVGKCDQQSAQASKGKVFDIAECRNVKVINSYGRQFQSNFAFVEGTCEGIEFDNTRIENTHATRNNTIGLVACAGNAKVSLRNTVFTGKSSVLYGTNAGDDMTFHDTTIRMDGTPIIPPPMARFTGRFNLNGTVYTEVKRKSVIARLLPSQAGGFDVTLPSGIARRLRVYVSSATGITQFFPHNGTSNAGDQRGLLTAGTNVDIPVCGLGSGYNLNQFTPKVASFYTDGTVPAGSYVVVDLDYYASGVDDKAMTQENYDLLQLRDANLYRSGANALKTDGDLTIVGTLNAGTIAGVANGTSPLGPTLPFNIVPSTASALVALGAANRGVFARVINGGTISKVRIRVGTASGNISVAAYSNSGTGTSAAPGTRLATSGAVACPAAGVNDVSLGTTITLAPGDWLCLTCDNNTATFGAAGTSQIASNLSAGFMYYNDTAHPAPSPYAGGNAGIVGPLCLIGVP